jgi:hypothetical protein
LPFRALLGHTSILMTTRYVHPALAQKRVTMEKFEGFRGDGMISGAAKSCGSYKSRYRRASDDSLRRDAQESQARSVRRGAGR